MNGRVRLGGLAITALLITVIAAPAHAEVINGTGGPDYLEGNNFVADTMHGNGGNDHVLGLSGDDKVYGDAGADVLSPGDGLDYVYGGYGYDHIDMYIDGSEDWVACGPDGGIVVFHGHLSELHEDMYATTHNCDVAYRD